MHDVAAVVTIACIKDTVAVDIVRGISTAIVVPWPSSVTCLGGRGNDGDESAR